MDEIRKKISKNLEDKIMDLFQELGQKCHCGGKCKRGKKIRAKLSASAEANLPFPKCHTNIFFCVRHDMKLLRQYQMRSVQDF